jgi:hypothetical protein
MSGLSWSFITCVIRTGKALLNGPASHGRNTRLVNKTNFSIADEMSSSNFAVYQ